MPNWCSQDLKVTGPKADITEFMEYAKEEKNPLSLNKFIPYPQHFIEADRKRSEALKNAKTPDERAKAFDIPDGLNNGGYEWCRDNWGTKWNTCNTVLKPRAKSGRTLCYKCDSAWSPINKVVLAMSKLFTKLTFDLRFYEQGAAYQGRYIVRAGEVMHDQQKAYRGSRGSRGG